MDREAWQTTVHGVTKRVGHDLVTKQQHKLVLSALRVHPVCWFGLPSFTLVFYSWYEVLFLYLVPRCQYLIWWWAGTLATLNPWKLKRSWSSTVDSGASEPHLYSLSTLQVSSREVSGFLFILLSFRGLWFCGRGWECEKVGMGCAEYSISNFGLGANDVSIQNVWTCLKHPSDANSVWCWGSCAMSICCRVSVE